MPPIDKLFKTYQNGIISVVLILFCLSATVFAVFPAISKIQEMVGEVRDLSEQTSLLQKKLDTLNALDEDELRLKLTNALSAVPSERSFPTLFETVEGVAAQTGVVVIQMSITGGATLATPSSSKISAADKKLGTRTIPFTVTVNGSLSAVEQFIASVPTVRRLLRTRVFSITFPKDLRPLTVSMDMDAFYEPLPTNLGTAKTVLPTLSEAEEAVIVRLSNMPLASQGSGSLPPPLIGKAKENPFAP